jgi:hypothetical protein
VHQVGFYYTELSKKFKSSATKQWRAEVGGGWWFNPPPPRNSEVLTKLSRNSLKVPKIKKMLPYEMNFLVPNYGCKPLTRALPPPRSPSSLSSALNWICWTHTHTHTHTRALTKFLGTPLLQSCLPFFLCDQCVPEVDNENIRLAIAL